MLERAAEPDTAVCETTAERDGSCGVHVTGGDGDEVEHSVASALRLLEVDAHCDVDGLPVSERDARAECVTVADALSDFDTLPVVDSCIVTEALTVCKADRVHAVSVADIVAIVRLPEAEDDTEADGDGAALELVEMDCVGIEAKGDAEFELLALRLGVDDAHADVEERRLGFGEDDDESERVSCTLAVPHADVDAERFPVALQTAVREPRVEVVGVVDSRGLTLADKL